MQQLAGLRFVPEIAGGRRRPAEFQPALAALAELATGFVDDADLVPGQRLPTGDDLDRSRIFGLCRFGHAMAAQCVPVDAIDHRQTTRRREGQPDRILRQAIDRPHGLRSEAVPSKTLDEASQGLWADRFRAVRHHPQRGEIEACETGFVDLVEA